MPHSVTPEDESMPNETMPVQNNNADGETQMTEGTLIAESEEQEGDTQATDSTDQDMTMADIENVEAELPVKDIVKEEVTTEVKLEDLFADMESDDEFPSSAMPDVKLSSSPEAPGSPV